MSNTQGSPGDESPASLQAVLKEYGLRRAGSPVAVAGGFSGAGVWRVETASGTFAVRRWPRGGLPANRLLGLHALLSHIRASGVPPVAVPVGSLRGSTLTRVGGERWQVEPWLPGTADFHASPSDVRLGNAMKALAAWHEAARTFVASRRAGEWFSQSRGPCSSVVRRLSLCREWADQLPVLVPAIKRDESEFGALAARVADLASDQLPRVQNELSGFAETAVPQQPCLRDIWHDHVLFENDDVTGLIDPSAAATASVATDLARLLGSFLGDDFTRWAVALDSYSSHRSLSPLEQSLVFALDRSAVVLSPLTWLRRKYNETAPIDDAAVIPRLEQLLVRLEGLAGR